jgi:hypothetical protein
VLTVDIGDRDSEFHIAREVHTRFAIREPDFPTGEGEIAEKCTVGKRLPRELEELCNSSGLCVVEGPGESDRAVEGRLRQSGIRA